MSSEQCVQTLLMQDSWPCTTSLQSMHTPRLFDVASMEETLGLTSVPLTAICSKRAGNLFSNCSSPLQSAGNIWSEPDPIARKSAVHVNLSFTCAQTVSLLSWSLKFLASFDSSELWTHVDPPRRVRWNTRGRWPRRDKHQGRGGHAPGNCRWFFGKVLNHKDSKGNNNKNRKTR